MGKLPGGEAVEAHVLSGAGGLSVQVLTYGAIVSHLRVPDRHGRLGDVVLGFDRLEDYLKAHPYFGVMAGRVAGRISGGRFNLDGRAYELARNDGPNHLHGGKLGFDKKLWSVTGVQGDERGVSLRMSRVSPDGEEGYPGTVDVSVTFIVTVDNKFIVDVEATADAPTPFSLTHHSYFNLSGEGSGTIEEHELEIFGDAYAPADESFGLIGRRQAVGANDFRRARRMGEVIPQLHGQHGDLYFVNRPAGRERKACVPAARLVDPASGRVMEVSTTEDCLQLYTGAKLDGKLVGKSGRVYGPLAGLCLECEGYPDGANVPELGDIILRLGRVARQRSVYAFSVV
jgi:aldose 1-epimerase